LGGGWSFGPEAQNLDMPVYDFLNSLLPQCFKIYNSATLKMHIWPANVMSVEPPPLASFWGESTPLFQSGLSRYAVLQLS